MATLFAVVAYIIGLFGTLFLVPGIPCYLLVAAIQRRRTSFFVAVALLCGYLGGATLVWNLIPSNWPLSLSKTFAASVNAAKYGHPTEHYAQGIVACMAFAAVMGAIAVGGLTAFLFKHSHVNPHASA